MTDENKATFEDSTAYHLGKLIEALRREGCAVVATGDVLPWTTSDVVYHLERLRAERDHFKRCNDPEVCVDDVGPHETWRGCEHHIRKALGA